MPSYSLHSSATGYRQRGLALLGLLLILVLGGTLLFLGVHNNRTLALDDAVVMTELHAAKEALVAYAAFIQNNGGGGFGRLVCQDGNNDGLPAGNQLNDIDCDDRTGRLPVSTVLADGSTYFFSDYGRDLDQQFWYRTSPAFLDGTQPLNPATVGQLSLDGLPGIVAVVLAPGEALAGQNRSNSGAAFFPDEHLDEDNSQNQGLGTSFISAYPASPDTFNDRVVAINSGELMSLITPQVAQDIFQRLELHYDTALAGSYPVDQTAFNDCMATLCDDVPVPAWYIDDQWENVTIYSYIDANTATVSFTGCNIVFSMQHNSGVSKSESACQGL